VEWERGAAFRQKVAAVAESGRAGERAPGVGLADADVDAGPSEVDGKQPKAWGTWSMPG
jgi:hypothetical protein